MAALVCGGLAALSLSFTLHRLQPVADAWHDHTGHSQAGCEELGARLPCSTVLQRCLNVEPRVSTDVDRSCAPAVYLPPTAGTARDTSSRRNSRRQQAV